MIGKPKVPAAPERATHTEMSRREVLEIAGAVSVTAALPMGIASAAEGGAANEVRLTINGTAVARRLDPRQSLLDLLREDLDLTGTKKGCNQGACGACTILLDGRRVVACLTLAAMHDGAEVTTIEGLASADTLHPLQQAFIDHDGLQCGFCTPGQIMSGVACIAEGHASTDDDIRFWMSGNICRCGAYPGIVAAVSEVARNG